MKETEANEQHKSIIGALKGAAPKWEIEQIDFVVGNRRSVVESDFYTKLKKLDIQERKKDKLFADHVTQVCKAHNQVIVSFLMIGGELVFFSFLYIKLFELGVEVAIWEVD